MQILPYFPPKFPILRSAPLSPILFPLPVLSLGRQLTEEDRERQVRAENYASTWVAESLEILYN